MSKTNCLNPRTVEELFRDLAKMTPDSKIIGGGTDLIIRLNMGACKPDALLYIGGVEELRAIRRRDDAVEIGAAATMAEIHRSPLIQGALGAVADAAADVGSAQIRNNGTIGGNVGNASPAGDLIPALFLLGAVLEIATPTGMRKAPIHEVIVGPSKTTLAHNEAVARILIPHPPGEYRSAFVKLGFRRAVTISRIGLAVGVIRDSKGIVTQAQVVAGAISLTPLHVERAEALMLGRPIDGAVKEEVGQALSDLIMEVTPEMFDRDYKVGSARAVAEDVLNKLS